MRTPTARLRSRLAHQRMSRGRSRSSVLWRCRPMAGSTCIRCGGRHLVQGICGGGKNIGYGFQPHGLRYGLWDWNALVVGQVEDDLTACLSCGLVWFEVTPGKLRELIEKRGTEEVKRSLPRQRLSPNWTEPT